MTVDDALKIIAQERLDAMAEGMTAEECSQIAAYVLHDAVLKDRRAMLTLRERHIAAQDEVDRLAELLRKADPSWGSPMHLNHRTTKLVYNKETRKIDMVKDHDGLVVDSFDPPEGM